MIASREQKLTMRLRALLVGLGENISTDPNWGNFHDGITVGCGHTGDERCQLAWWLAHSFPGADVFVTRWHAYVTPPELYGGIAGSIKVMMHENVRAMIRIRPFDGPRKPGPTVSCMANVITLASKETEEVGGQ